MSADGVKTLIECCMRHNTNAVRAGTKMQPKHHLFMHLTLGIARKGNPKSCTTYLGESLNRTLMGLDDWVKTHWQEMERIRAAQVDSE